MWGIREDPGTGELFSKGTVIMMVMMMKKKNRDCETEEFQKQKLNKK